jgi:hypothetical protein
MKLISGLFVSFRSFGVDRMTKVNILKTKREFLAIIERMAQVAVPEKRDNVLRFMATMEQEIAASRDEVDESNLE